MVSLLDALERASVPSRRWRWIAIGAAIAVAGGITALVMTRSTEPARPALCDEPDPPAGLADAHVAARWTAAVGDACKLDPAVRDPRLACLLDAGDLIAAEAATRSPPAPFPTDIALGPCTAMPPPMPGDPAVRAQIADVRAAAARMRHAPFNDDDAHALARRADRLNWRPVVLEVQLVAGLAAQRDERYDAARAFLDEAVTSASVVADPRREAIALIARVQIAVIQLAHPNEADELDGIVRLARDAIDHAGNDPRQVAELQLALGEVNLGQGRIDDAIRRLDDARDKLAAVDEAARSRAAAWLEIEALLQRGKLADLDRAQDIVPAPFGPHETDRDREIRARWLALELARRRFDRAAQRTGARRLLDEVAPTDTHHGLLEIALAAELGPVMAMRPVTDQASRRGRVVDGTGAPVAGARVVAWSAQLGADAKELDALGGAEAVTTTNPDGTFSLAGSPWVVAEAAGGRSVPVAFAADATLAIAKPRSITGRIEFPTDHPGGIAVRAEHRLATDEASRTTAMFASHASAVTDTGEFELANLPDTTYQVVATARVGRDAVRVTELTADKPVWNGEVTYDVIVRTKKSRPQRVWMIIEIGPRAAGVTEFYALTDTSPDRVIAYPTPVGARDTTVAGKRKYEPGDYHVVFRGPGQITNACAENDDVFSCAMLMDLEVEGDTIAAVVTL